MAAAAPHRTRHYGKLLAWRRALLLTGVIGLSALMAGLGVAGSFALLQVKIKYQHAIAQTS